MQSSVTTLVKMVNKIVTFFESQSPSDNHEAAAAAATHLKMFWPPSMRKELVENYQSGRLSGLHPIAEVALQHHRTALGLGEARPSEPQASVLVRHHELPVLVLPAVVAPLDDIGALGQRAA